MGNIDIIRKISEGTRITENVNIEFEGEQYPFEIRQLSSGELGRLQTMEKKNINVKVDLQNGKRTATNVKDVEVKTAEFTEDQRKALYKAVALSLSVGKEKVTVQDIEDMPVGLPEIIFSEVIRISNLSDNDLILIKNFRKNK